jgi:hypothetical protein
MAEMRSRCCIGHVPSVWNFFRYSRPSVGRGQQFVLETELGFTRTQALLAAGHDFSVNDLLWQASDQRVMISVVWVRALPVNRRQTPNSQRISNKRYRTPVQQVDLSLGTPQAPPPATKRCST